MKSGFEFLYTSRAEVCNHCHLLFSLANNRYAINPDAPVFSTVYKIEERLELKSGLYDLNTYHPLNSVLPSNVLPQHKTSSITVTIF